VSYFGEAPGGRRGPWRGNDDEERPPQVIDALPGENPKDTGEEPEQPTEPETTPEVEPGAEAEPEAEPGEEPPSGAVAPESEPEEEPGEEPEPEEGEEDEDEEVSEAREGGGVLHHVGHLLKRAGAAASGSKAAQQAKARASGAAHKVGAALAKKHGIDVGKFYGTSDSGEQKKLAKIKGAKAPSAGSRIGALRQRAAVVGGKSRASLLRRVRPAKRIKIKSRK
jgi:outer membrane biosynthesis protein TonB